MRASKQQPKALAVYDDCHNAGTFFRVPATGNVENQRELQDRGVFASFV